MTTTTDSHAGELLLSQLSHQDVFSGLGLLNLSHKPAAQRLLQHLAEAPDFAACWPYLLTALAHAASPDRALVNFDRFVQNSGEPAALFRQLARQPRILEILLTLFAGSQFLTEILLRHPEYLDQLKSYKRLNQPKNAAQLLEEARMVATEAMGRGGKEADFSLSLLDALRRFQRRELLCIGTADLLGLSDLPAITAQLSSLADSLVQACLSAATGPNPLSSEQFVVVALGKLGGEELNYSSDIDLLFLAAENPAAYQPVGQRLVDLLGRVTGEGFLYRVDMRLRPWGRAGALVSSLEGYLAYLAKHAGLWEKQALLKARIIAGSQTLGREFLDRAQPLIFEANSHEIRSEVHALKQRIEANLRRRGQEWGEVKLGQGSIRDIEFVVQYLQLEHGGQQPELRSPNTLEALNRLAAKRLLLADEYRALVDGYIFLRTLEHHLQLMHYQQTHLLPGEAEALGHLARRLGFQGPAAGSHFVARYQQHSAVIRAIYQNHFAEQRRSTMTASQSLAVKPNVVPHLVRMHPSYAATFTDADIQRHTFLAEQLDDCQQVKVEALPLDEPYWRVTIVGYDYLGELSLICGLLFVYGFDIVDGHVFTYDPAPDPASAAPRQRRSTQPRPHKLKPAQQPDSRKKIVDEFTVRAIAGERQAAPDFWSGYAQELAALVNRLAAGEQRQAQGELAQRVGETLRETVVTPQLLYPIDIEIDNESSASHTVLRIDAPDTVGFLYEFTNALALNGVNISRMTVETVGQRVRDTLYVTDAHGQKITAAARQHELRVATVLTKHFTHLLPRSPNPALALLHFREFLGQLFLRPDWPAELASLEQPEVLDSLARLLGVSDFLWNDFLRMQHTNLFPVVRDVAALAAAKSKTTLQAELSAALESANDGQTRRVVLNAFKDREMFRIDMRQIQGHIARFGQFSQELTDLAEVTLETAARICEEELRTQFGQPCLEDDQFSAWSICGLGKAGGRELGFASDIELMLIYAGNGQTTGPRVITSAEFYDKLVQEVNQAIRARQEGVFELDLRLRPYGKAGSMAVSLDAFRRYFGPEGDAWPYERQALVKLRPMSGSADLGGQIVRLRDELVYNGLPFDIAARRAMRERQVRHLVTAGTINAKFSPGGLVDVEYLVQGLQITHGQANPGLRLTNTREALRVLAAAAIILPDDYDTLREAHIFLRRLINALRMVRGHAKDLTLPSAASEEFAFLARRLDYGRQTAQLRDDLTQHMTAVQKLSTTLLS